MARGDLGVETDLAHIHALQMLSLRRQCPGGTVVTATEMLESMVDRTHRTRA